MPTVAKPGFDAEEIESDAGVIIRLRGELDLVSEPQLAGVVDRILARGTRQLAVDLRELTFMDSSGVSAMVTAERACRRHGMRFLLISGSAAIGELLAMCGLDGYFEIVP